MGSLKKADPAPKKRNSGKFARSKGSRGERALRDYLRQLGYTSDRVPGSGAFIGRQLNNLPGDVTAVKGNQTLLFEVKNKESFGKIYELYNEHCKVLQDDLLSFVCPTQSNTCVNISTSLDAVLEINGLYEFMAEHPLYNKYKKTFSKIQGLEKLLKGADVLAIKMNHKPFLFIKFL